ncbi:LysR family transcriptional regulator [Noviherbaspirillum pedocola]|nr:LysR family transcriptional regulator [Noviherbaspirillum pedocola]
MPENTDRSVTAQSAPEAGSKLPNSHISLKQWNMLVAVVRSTSYSHAAEQLHVSQPAISYALTKIEEHVGFPILQLEGRRSRITEAGRQLVARVESLLQQAIQVEQFAAGLKKSWRPRLRLVVDDAFPMELLLPALQLHSSEEAAAKVTLLALPATDIPKFMQERNAELAITRQLHHELQGDVLVETRYLPVAHPSHSLFAMDAPLTEEDLHDETRVVVGSNQDAPPIGAHPVRNLWTVSSLDTAEKILAKGIGFGWLPHYQVRDAIVRGELAVLPLRSSAAASACFHLVHLASSIPSTDANRLARTLHDAIALDGQSMPHLSIAA